MAAKALPSISDLRKALDYDPETGALTWKPRQVGVSKDERASKIWNTKFSRKVAGSIGGNGYIMVSVFWKNSIRAHRIAWALYHGEWPDGDLDHINGNRADNRIENLRLVTRAENARNSAMPETNTSGAVGVSWHRQRGKWQVKITVSGRQKHLGLFSDFDAAVAARKSAEAAHGFHPNHGRTPR